MTDTTETAGMHEMADTTQTAPTTDTDGPASDATRPGPAAGRRPATPGDGLPATSVVMITRDRRHLLERHLPILLGDPATTELVVVDDGSTDDTAALLGALAAGDDRVVPVSIPNGGMDNARRTGVDRATGEVIVLMDDDVEPSADLVTRHASRHRDDTGIVVVGYMPIDRSDPHSYTTSVYARDYETVVGRYESDPERILFDLWNGQVSMRRADYLRAREGDTTWPRAAFFEDRHLGLELHRIGLRGCFDRTIAARHRHGSDVARFRRTARAIGYGSELIHERHSDQLGSANVSTAVDDLPRVVGWLVRIGDLPLGPAASSALAAVATFASRVRWSWLERTSTHLVRRIEVRVGARRRRREVAGGR